MTSKDILLTIVLYPRWVVFTPPEQQPLEFRWLLTAWITTVLYALGMAGGFFFAGIFTLRAIMGYGSLHPLLPGFYFLVAWILFGIWIVVRSRIHQRSRVRV